MKTINLLLAVMLTAFITNCYSQEKTTDSNQIIRPIQLALITPLGTNGLESDKVTNNFSLNLLAGYSGGLHGCEIAGFANIIKGKVTGLQIAGFSNTNLNAVKGCQITGFANVCNSSATGLQLAGFSNVVKDSIKALQISGFANIANAMPVGGQISGFANVCNGDSKGLQITGFSNVNNGNSKSLQIAGFSNINNGDFTGLQISGFLNRVKKLNGAQIGFINLSDTVEKGIALGFLSIVKKGYRTIEISGNESYYGTVSFKTGTEQFYNIISLGSRLKNNAITWGWGYGLGTMFPVHNKIKMNFDIISYHINEDVWFTNRLNLLNKANLAVNYRLNNYVTVFGGLTWNVLVSDTEDEEGKPVSTSIVSWSSYNKTHNNTNVKMYPGFTVGVKL